MRFIKKIGLFFSPVFDADAFRTVLRNIQLFQPDVIHIHGFLPQWTWSAFEAAIRSDVPVVHTMHAYGLICPANLLLKADGQICKEPIRPIKTACLFNQCKTSGLALKIMNTRSLSSASARQITSHGHFTVISPTPVGRDLLIRDRVPKENVIIKPHSVPRNLFVSSKSASKQVLFVGRLTTEKGLPHIIREFHKLKPCGLRLKIIGDGPVRTSLEELAGSLGIADSIDFAGYQPAESCAREYASSLCLLVNPSSYEGFGLVVVEAFSAGLPVIAPKFGAMLFLVRDGFNGFLIDPENRLFSEKVKELQDSDSMRKWMGQNALVTYEALFTQKQNLPRLLGCYKYALMKARKSIPAILDSVNAANPEEDPYEGHAHK